MFKQMEIDAQLEEEGGEAHAKEMDKLDVRPLDPRWRSGAINIKPVGDPFAGFAKGPRDGY